MTIRRYITPIFALTLLPALSERILAQEIRPDFSVGILTMLEILGIKEFLLTVIPFDGGALNSMVAMGHETFHAFDHSNYVFNSANAGYSKDIVEPRAVSFGNYLRQAYSLSPLREQYGNIKGNFHQFTGNEEISNFTTLGNNSDKTSYGFSYTKTTTIVESYKTFLGIKTPDKTRTETATYYMTVSRDKNNNVSFQTFSNEEAYKKATSNW